MNIADAATATVDDYPGGARSLAPRIGKPESTLCAEVAQRGTAKLGAQTAARMVKLTGDPRIMSAFVAECGYTGIFVRLDGLAPEGTDPQHMAEVAKEVSDTLMSFAQAVADRKITGNEREEIMREAGEAHAAIQRLCEATEALYQAGQPHLKVVGS